MNVALEERPKPAPFPYDDFGMRLAQAHGLMFTNRFGGNKPPLRGGPVCSGELPQRPQHDPV